VSGRTTSQALRGDTLSPETAQLKRRPRIGGQPAALLFLLPGLILFIAFIVWPLLYSLRISFYDWKIVNPAQSVYLGLQNYVDALTDPIFQRSVLNTLVYGLVTVPGQIILGTLVALLLNDRFPGRAFFRTVYYLPVITSWVIVTSLFEYLFNGQAGLVNFVLQSLGLIHQPIRWLADARLVMVPLTLLGIWKGIGWTAVIVLAGLQSIPTQLYEAAAVDGANLSQRLRRITLPLLRPTFIFLIVVLTIGALNVYISGLLINRAGNLQDEAHFVLTWMDKQTFENFNFGQGAAISYLLTAVVFVVSLVQLRLLQRGSDNT
jgi:multiple sugar transport system permease protein